MQVDGDHQLINSKETHTHTHTPVVSGVDFRELQFGAPQTGNSSN